MSSRFARRGMVVRFASQRSTWREDRSGGVRPPEETMYCGQSMIRAAILGPMNAGLSGGDRCQLS
jgi:hypothetical protein